MKDRNLRPRRSLCIESLESRCLLAADLRISEFLASNSGSLADGDGAFSDWIEIENAGDSVVDLSDWYLTDDTNNLTKWRFPAGQLEGGEYLLVFASAPTNEAGEVLNDYVDSDGNPHASFRLRANGRVLGIGRWRRARPDCCQ